MQYRFVRAMDERHEFFRHCFERALEAGHSRDLFDDFSVGLAGHLDSVDTSTSRLFGRVAAASQVRLLSDTYARASAALANFVSSPPGGDACFVAAWSELRTAVDRMCAVESHIVVPLLLYAGSHVDLLRVDVQLEDGLENYIGVVGIAGMAPLESVDVEPVDVTEPARARPPAPPLP
jgi:hypothetical protein